MGLKQVQKSSVSFKVLKKNTKKIVLPRKSAEKSTLKSIFGGPEPICRKAEAVYAILNGLPIKNKIKQYVRKPFIPIQS